MQITREDRVQITLKNAPVSAKKTLERAFDGSASPRQAIKAKCLECLGFDRKAITDCTGYSCPLWAYRPFQTVETAVVE